MKYDESIDDSEFSISDEGFKEKSKCVGLLPVQNYLNKIDLVNHVKLKEKGIKKFNFQVEITEEVGRYLDSI